jgi:glycosyltransferase involved in cell wall biosynthesis
MIKDNRGMAQVSSLPRSLDPRECSTVLSVVVPSFNEEQVLRQTHQRLLTALAPLETEFEIVYVDDGSTDGTATILHDLSATDSRVRVVRFARNFGHQMAVTAGIDHSRGEAVVLIDADLQDPPEVIPRMVDLWREGYEVVYGVRRHRPGETIIKRSSAAAFYRMINLMSDVPIPLDTGDFRLMDRCVVDVLREMPEQHRFIRGMVSWVGFKQCPIYYERSPRFAGESKYPLGKMVRFALDGVTSFSTVPLRWATWAGLLAAGISLLGIIYAIITRLMTNSWVPGWAAIFVAVLFVGGVQLLSLGAIGEYVGRIYGEAKGRPLYIVAERLGFGSIDSRSRPAMASNLESPQWAASLRRSREMYTSGPSIANVTAAAQEAVL